MNGEKNISAQVYICRERKVPRLTKHDELPGAFSLQQHSILEMLVNSYVEEEEQSHESSKG